MHNVCLVAVVAALAVVPTVLSSCNRLETEEAENAFKNCVESAQAGIVRKVADLDVGRICGALENMLGVCSDQMDRLAACKGSAHAERIKKLHLSVTADIVQSIRRGVNLERCSVFTRKTTVPADNGYGDRHGSNAINDGRVGRHSDEGGHAAHHNAAAASSFHLMLHLPAFLILSRLLW